MSWQPMAEAVVDKKVYIQKQKKKIENSINI